jgi:hypothetical protein
MSGSLVRRIEALERAESSTMLGFEWLFVPIEEWPPNATLKLLFSFEDMFSPFLPNAEA